MLKAAEQISDSPFRHARVLEYSQHFITVKTLYYTCVIQTGELHNTMLVFYVYTID